jgi:cyclophilin family peptidyl-prolyl cis-trans isomerase
MRLHLSNLKFQISNFKCLLAICLWLSLTVGVAAQPARKKNAPPPDPPVTPEEASKLEAVINTELGEMRMEFFPEFAPQHAIAFIKRARAGFYDGSAFHRVIARGLIQGGDPLLKENAPRARWGTGGLNLLKDEFSEMKHIRGVVSTARIPDKPNSGGAQFFVCAGAQPQLDGKFTAFGLVNEGLHVLDQISQVEADESQKTVKPVKIISIKIEPKKTEPYRDANANEMRKEVLFKTTLGDITIALDPDLAPEHVRNFLRLVETGWYDHTAFHRIVPGFVVQGGMGSSRQPYAYHPADRWVKNLAGEFSKDRKHVRGTVSMARADDPNSAQTSFFIVLRDAANLDTKYSIFGKVVDGFEVLDRMEQAPRKAETGIDKDTPLQRIELIEAVIKP